MNSKKSLKTKKQKRKKKLAKVQEEVVLETYQDFVEAVSN